ncbi:acetoin reductase [Peniophora sp. CONT]|nr:acetoin reductase [Peniophora sp. CONT]
MARVALITGSARGIGRAIALRLAANGLDVALLDLPNSTDALGSVAEEVSKLGRRAVVLTADVSVEAEVKEAIRSCVEKLGSLDVMVANAGVLGPVKGILETSVEDLDRLYSINIRGVFLCYKYAAIQMIEQGRGGRIIGASSVAGKQGYPMLFSYSASKFAVRSMTQTSAGALGQHKITVNAYAPGTVESDMGTALGQGVKDAGMDPALIVPTIAGHIGTGDDVAGLVSYLASDAASFITGQTISINGGMYFD